MKQLFAALGAGLSLAACGGDGLLAGIPPPKPHAGRASGLGEVQLERFRVGCA